MESGRHARLERCPRQQVASELLAREFIERHVSIDGVDDPITPTPRPWTLPVFLVTIGVGIAGEIEPVPSPALAKMRRVEQAIDDTLVRSVARVGKKRFDFLARRWQSGEIETQPPQ